VDPRAGLEDVEKRKFLTLSGLELRPLGRPTRSQLLIPTALYLILKAQVAFTISVKGNSRVLKIHQLLRLKNFLSETLKIDLRSYSKVSLNDLA
jgi:hypothetical protein